MYFFRDPNQVPGVPSPRHWPQHTPKGREYLELNSKFVNATDKSIGMY